MRTTTLAESVMAEDDFRSPSICIVEDEQDIRTLLSFLCEGEGFEVVGEASNGIDAIAQVLENPPDVAIVDYFMPRMDGERTALALRALVPHAHVIAFSGSLIEKPYWADSYVPKKRMFDLPAIIRSVMQGRRLQPPANL